MNRIILSLLCLTISATAAEYDGPSKRGLPRPQQAGFTGSLYINHINNLRDAPQSHYQNTDCGNLVITQQTFFEPEEFKLINKVFPNLKVLSINPENIVDIRGFLHCISQTLRSLLTLDLGIVFGDLYEAYESTARDLRLKLMITRQPPKVISLK